MVTLNPINNSTIQTLPSLDELRAAGFDLSKIPVKPDARILNSTAQQMTTPNSSNHMQNIDADASTCFKQPNTQPISQDLLIGEVKGIYSGLVMVENKCNEVIQSNKGSNVRLNNEQMQAVTALHRTLLHEFHDFFLASHHPTASQQLKALSDKYELPKRMLINGVQNPLTFALSKDTTSSKEHYKVMLRTAHSICSLMSEHPDTQLADQFKISQQVLTGHLKNI